MDNEETKTPVEETPAPATDMPTGEAMPGTETAPAPEETPAA